MTDLRNTVPLLKESNVSCAESTVGILHDEFSGHKSQVRFLGGESNVEFLMGTQELPHETREKLTVLREGACAKARRITEKDRPHLGDQEKPEGHSKPLKGKQSYFHSKVTLVTKF